MRDVYVWGLSESVSCAMSWVESYIMHSVQSVDHITIRPINPNKDVLDPARAGFYLLRVLVHLWADTLQQDRIQRVRRVRDKDPRERENAHWQRAAHKCARPYHHDYWSQELIKTTVDNSAAVCETTRIGVTVPTMSLPSRRTLWLHMATGVLLQVHISTDIAKDRG